jgi:hypothetical protein
LYGRGGQGFGLSASGRNRERPGSSALQFRRIGRPKVRRMMSMDTGQLRDGFLPCGARVREPGSVMRDRAA